MEAYRLDLKSGQLRQLTEAEWLDPASLALLPNERNLCCLDGGRMMQVSLGGQRPREIYGPADGFEIRPDIGVHDDGTYVTLVEKNGDNFRLRLLRMAATVAATTLAEADEEIGDPLPRPRRASVLYRRAGGLWLANFDGKQNYRLRTAEGQAGPAVWSPDGRTVLYLNVPADRRKLNSIREFTPDTNEDRAVADTSQFVGFERNQDASVFVGASGSKASPHVLLLVRAVKRELTLCEHRASDPRMVAPFFSPNSQRIFFGSDQHGKPAIYSMMVDRLVEETKEEREPPER
jgi:oligogalacturonide lyase